MFRRSLVWRNLCGLFAFALTPVWSAAEMQRGVIDLPGGPGELRKARSATAPVAATIKAGEPFTFQPDEAHEWGEVTLATGESGWVPLSAIRLFYDERDLPQKDPTGTSEIDDAARARGFDYVKVTRRAAQGDPKALRQFFALAEAADGAASESITSIPTVVVHLLGDTRFAKYLRTQPAAEQVLVRNIVLSDGRLPPTTLYLQRHFPETTKVLFPSERVGWISPNGRYAIRKVFSDAFNLRGSKIARAELLEKKTGKVLLDLTADDIGTGAYREGEVRWAPDSKRFASRTSDLTQEEGNLFSTPRPRVLRKQTTVYELNGDAWSRVELPLDEVPGRDRDKELERAMLGHDYIEPVRWPKANVLLLERHEYYEKLKPIVAGGQTFQSIVPLARWYTITVTFPADGPPSLVWKLREDH